MLPKGRASAIDSVIWFRNLQLRKIVIPSSIVYRGRSRILSLIGRRLIFLSNYRVDLLLQPHLWSTVVTYIMSFLVTVIVLVGFSVFLTLRSSLTSSFPKRSSLRYSLGSVDFYSVRVASFVPSRLASRNIASTSASLTYISFFFYSSLIETVVDIDRRFNKRI